MVAGKPLCKVGSRILLWDLASHTLTTVETSNGIVVAAITLPKVSQVAVTGPIDPDMFLMNADGTVQRCEAIVRTNSAEPTKIAP